MEIKLSQYNLEVPVKEKVYLYNTLSESSVLLTQEQLSCIKNVVKYKNKDDVGEKKWSEVITFLIENGFVVSKETDELALSIAKYNRIISDMSQLSLVIAPSLKCNMNCYYCYEGDKSDSSLQAGDIDTLLLFIQSRLSENGKLSITWFGGEPLLVKDFILNTAQKLQTICSKMNVTYFFRMVSNCYYLDIDTAQELVKYGINSVQVTLDGSRREHNLVRRSRVTGTSTEEDSFDRILANIHAASKYLHFRIRVNVSQLNIDSLPRLIKQLKEAGLADRKFELYFYPVYNFKPTDNLANYLPKKNVHFTMEQFAKLEGQLLRLAIAEGFEIFTPTAIREGFVGCYAMCDNAFIIDYKGDLRKCDHELGISGTAFGNMNHSDEITNEENLRKWSKRKPESYSSCRECVFLPGCYAYCPHSNITLPELEPRCPTYKYNWKELFPIYLEKRHLLLEKREGAGS